MVKIKIFREDSRICGFEIKGHAMHKLDNEEFDLVCAGVSSISLAAVEGLAEYLGIKLEDPQCREGYLFCKLPQNIDEKRDLQAQAILETMVLGLRGIAESYPEHVKFL